MPFFSNLKKVLNLGGDAKKKKPNLEHIAVDVDPEEVRFISHVTSRSHELLAYPLGSDPNCQHIYSDENFAFAPPMKSACKILLLCRTVLHFDKNITQGIM